MYDDDDTMDENRNKTRRGSRLTDQVEMDDEPALQGYERCVDHMSVALQKVSESIGGFNVL